MEISTLSSGPAPSVASSTKTVTSSCGLVSKSSAVPAFRNSSPPSSSNNAASEPPRDTLFTPVMSSVTATSAIFKRVAVLVSSARLAGAPVAETLGASLVSVMAMVRLALASGVPTSSVSLTSSVTSSCGLASKSSAVPDARKISVPSISNKAASAPLRPSSSVPNPSSVTAKSATLMREDVSSVSPSVETVGVMTTVGASFTSVMAMARAALSSGLPGMVPSFTVTVTSRTGLVSKSRTVPAFRNRSPS